MFYFSRFKFKIMIIKCEEFFEQLSSWVVKGKLWEVFRYDFFLGISSGCHHAPTPKKAPPLPNVNGNIRREREWYYLDAFLTSVVWWLVNFNNVVIVESSVSIVIGKLICASVVSGNGFTLIYLVVASIIQSVFATVVFGNGDKFNIPVYSHIPCCRCYSYHCFRCYW